MIINKIIEKIQIVNGIHGLIISSYNNYEETSFHGGFYYLEISHMFEEITLSNKYHYHNLLSVMMLGAWIYFGIKGSRLKNQEIKRKISIWIILGCLIQEIMDFMNRIFLDPNYIFSIQRDLPFLQFCQISFYFSLLCMFFTRKKINENKKYSRNQFLFDGAFLLGFSGAFQGIITPEFVNINNIMGVICIQLQHSLIILNLVWLMFAYDYRLKFKGVCLTYLLINLIAPFALFLNNLLGTNSAGDPANYFYVNELPKVDNVLLNFVSQHPSPDYILYIQPVFIIYFLLLYAPFALLNKIKK